MASPPVSASTHGHAARWQAWQTAREAAFDVAIVGAGVGGAAVFRELSRRGYSVLLVDQGDFAGGTSQSSGMLLWGGLLYLQSLDIATVRSLSLAREALIEAQSEDVAVASFRYLSLRAGGRHAWHVRAALEAYWWLGGRQRRRPRRERDFATRALLQADRFGDSLVYEEACVVESDARLVLDWVLRAARQDCVALNHCAVVTGRRDRAWHLELEDRRTEARGTARAAILVNAAGVWANDVADTLGVQTRHRHVLSKGVYVGLRRPETLHEFLAFEMGRHGDSQTFTPWGPIALWGPTETLLPSLDGGFVPNVQDVRFLLDQANMNLAGRRDAADVVSLRTGVRPLAVARAFSREVYPLALSRRHVVDVDRDRVALTLFGGKITSAPALAREAADLIARQVVPRHPRPTARSHEAPPRRFMFPGLDAPLVDPSWSARHEGCATLLDYVRRRTNIAQWTPRMGLGAHDEYRSAVRHIAAMIHGEPDADAATTELIALADAQDRLLAQV